MNDRNNMFAGDGDSDATGEEFDAVITGVTVSSGTRYYRWSELEPDSVTGALAVMVNGRQGTYDPSGPTGVSPTVELNNYNVNVGTNIHLRLRSIVNGDTFYSFESPLGPPVSQTYKEVEYASNAALPAVTYANGSAGVGATLTGNANGAIPFATFESGSPFSVTGARLLVKNQASALQNGIYTLTQIGDASTPFILTRATDADNDDELATALIRVLLGGTRENGGNGGTTWFNTIVGRPGTFVFGTTGTSWSQFGYGTVSSVTPPGTVLTQNGIPLAAFSTAAGAHDKVIGRVNLFYHDSLLGYSSVLLVSTLAVTEVLGQIYSVFNGVGYDQGVSSSTLGPGCEVAGGIVIDPGTGSFLANPGNGLAAGSYP